MKTINARLLKTLERAEARILRLETALKNSGDYLQCNHCEGIAKHRPGTPEAAPSHLSLCGNWCMDCIDDEDGFEAFWTVAAGTGAFLVAYAIAPLFSTVSPRFAFYDGNVKAITGRAERDAEQWARDYALRRDPWGTTSEWRRDPIPSLETILSVLIDEERAEEVLSKVEKMGPKNSKFIAACRASRNPETLPTWERQTGAFLAKNEREIYQQALKAGIETRMAKLEETAA